MYADDDGTDGDSISNGNNTAAAANGNDVHANGGGDSRMAIGWQRFHDDNWTTTMYVDDDSDEDDGGDGNGDGDGDGNGDGNGNDNTAAAVTDGNNVNQDDSGNSRTAIGRRQLDDDNGMMAMRWRWAASDMQNACKSCTIHQSNNQLM